MKQYKLENIQGILLDFDGTIVPTERIFLDAWKDVFEKEYKCVFTDDEYIKYELMEDAKLIDYLIGSNKLNQNIAKNEMMEKVYDKYRIDFEKMLQENDFTQILNHIAAWKNAGINISIVSTSKRYYLDKFFDYYSQYKNLFSYIFCREDVEKLKPNPMVYILAANKMGIENSNCLVVEDSPKGIQGAIAANMQYVRVICNAINMRTFPSKNVPTVEMIKDIVC